MNWSRFLALTPHSSAIPCTERLRFQYCSVRNSIRLQSFWSQKSIILAKVSLRRFGIWFCNLACVSLSERHRPRIFDARFFGPTTAIAGGEHASNGKEGLAARTGCALSMLHPRVQELGKDKTGGAERLGRGHPQQYHDRRRRGQVISAPTEGLRRERPVPAVCENVRDILSHSGAFGISR